MSHIGAIFGGLLALFVLGLGSILWGSDHLDDKRCIASAALTGGTLLSGLSYGLWAWGFPAGWLL